MSDYVTVKFSGWDELQRKLEDLGKKGTKVARGAARAGGKVFKDEMVRLAPKRTGLLAKHFDVKTRKVKGEDLAVSALIGPNGKDVIHPQEKGKTKGLPRTAAFFTKLLEFGGSKMPKKPFMTQAFESAKNRALDAVIAYLKDKLL